jgi:hypothetical protein
MSNSTTLLDTIATNQSNKEVVVNSLLDAASPSMLWGRHASACSGLTFGYYGGTFVDSTGTLHAVANGTVTLTASVTNYLFADGTTGALSANTTGFPAGKVPLYSIVTGTTTVTSYTDDRSYQPSATAAAGGGSSTLSGLTDVNVTEGAGIDKFVLRWDNGSSKWIADARPYDLLMFSPGVPANSALMARVVIPRIITLPISLTGSYASATVAATAATVLTLAKNGSSIGTVNFALGATAGTFTFSSAVTTAAGDVLTVTNQATADATLANISITLAATR